ncbi:MAG: nucleotidyltransferase domain-containing protein [Candidatus Njordarchaeia archaeon]
MRRESYNLRKIFLMKRARIIAEREKKFEKFVEALKKQMVGKAAIYLIGSRAQGNALPYSDYDIIIFHKNNEKEIAETISKIRPKGVPIDIIYLPEEAIKDKIVQKMLKDAKKII